MITAIRVPAGVLAVSLLVTGCAQGGHATTPRAAAAEAVRLTSVPAPARSASTAPSELPGLGPGTLAEVPSTARQVVVVTGEGKDSSDATVVLHERTASGWQAGREWPAHNALKGWTSHHTAGDLHSPIGVFSLTDAGGLLPDPGTRLPYDHSGGFAIVGTGFEGESLSGSFDYVVAIDYNRKPGTSPRDWTRPLGAGRGGGIWFHVDHGGPTHACISLKKADMRALLRALDPARHPVVVMGDAASLAR
ncbi:L,D-transpeptidase family protein [Streptomyces sp. NPDC058891]|uniref:L,D-transpeptidase family protein n=1 Tax=unclassified Streptomyces TaxID=2593676 RepID=UPI0036D0E7E8